VQLLIRRRDAVLGRAGLVHIGGTSSFQLGVAEDALVSEAIRVGLSSTFAQPDEDPEAVELVEDLVHEQASAIEPDVVDGREAHTARCEQLPG
jgi:hypothetical protein